LNKAVECPEVDDVNKLKVDLNMYCSLMKDIVMDDLMTILLLQCTIMAEERERETYIL